MHKSFNLRSKESQFFVIAGVLGVCLFLLALFRANICFQVVVVVAAATAYGVGLWLWLEPLWVRSWHSTLGKGILLLFHAVAYLCSVMSARSLVSNATGLPAQDFDLTVNLIAMITYPLVLMSIVAVLVGCLGVLLLIGSGAFCVFKNPLSLIVDLVGESRLPSLKVLGVKINEWKYQCLGHGMGLIILMVVAVLFTIPYRGALRLAAPQIRDLAYCADYQDAARYPGVNHSCRLRLHDNGVISYACIESGHAVITVDKVK